MAHLSLRAAAARSIVAASCLALVACSAGSTPPARTTTPAATTPTAVTTSVAAGQPFTVDGPGVRVEGPAGALPAAATVTVSPAPAPPAQAGLDGVGPGFDVTFTGATLAAPVTVTAPAPRKPTATSAAGTAPDQLVPVFLHQEADGTLDLDPATLDATGRFVVRTQAFSLRWPAWLDLRALVAPLVHATANFVSGRTDPAPCAGNGPGWARLDKRTTIVHTCLTTNPDASKRPRAEVGLQANRSFWLRVVVPGSPDYIWTSESDSLEGKLLAKLVQKASGNAATRLLAPKGRLTAGYYRPADDVEGAFSTTQDEWTLALSVAQSFITNFDLRGVSYPGDRAGAMAGFGLLACSDAVPSDPKDAHGWWDFVVCIGKDAFASLDEPGKAFAAAKDLIGESSYTGQAEQLLTRTSKALKVVGKAFKLLGAGLLVRDIFQEIPDAVSGMTSAHAGDVVLFLTGRPQSFWGDWNVHGSTYHFAADGTGTARNHWGFTPDTQEWVNEVVRLRLSLSPDGSTLTAVVTGLGYEKITNAGTPVAIAAPQYPDDVTKVGDTYTVRFVGKDLMKATTTKGRSNLGNPYICGENTVDTSKCGA